MKKILIPIILLMAIFSFSMNFEIGLYPNFELDKNWNEANFKINHFSENFDFLADLSALNDGKYQPSHPDDIYFGYYFFMNEGGLKLHFEDIDFSFGRLRHDDLVDSPYSVFISSADNAANIMNLKYENDNMFYETRWIGLNHDSNSPLSFDMGDYVNYPERGANYKTYGLKFSNFRFAYQDASVYYDEYFAFEYFANPIPNFFVQYVTHSSGKPWSYGNNANAIMGFMLDYKDDDKYLYSQILVDDINMNRFLNPEGTQNPDKLAWSFGGDFYTEYGKFGLHHGGATKYTFSQPENDPYSYTYYPDVVYQYNGYKTILREDNNIGYIHGENNLAFMIDYYNDFFDDMNYSASLEYSITGSQSPIDPWHELATYNEGTYLLDEEVLEHSLIFKNNINMSFKYFDLGFGFSIGQIKNQLNLFLIEDTGRYMFKPDPDKDPNIFSFNLKISKQFSF